VGEFVDPTEKFLVPRELLVRRSRKFRDLLERQAGELSSKAIQLPNTPVQTMEAFFVWTFSPQPQIDERAAFSEVVRLGIFAWRYQISALSNQVTDMIRCNLANGHWQLQASILDDIYEAVPAESPLREVIRAALGWLPRSSGEEWKATFLKHSELGWDHYEAVRLGWTSQDYLSGACRFHDHQGVPHQDKSFVFGNQCAYAREECFPWWEEESMKGQKDEVGWKESRAVGQERDREQERCGADEERKEEKLSIEAVVDEAEEPVTMEAMQATEAVEAVVDDVATEAVVNGVATEAEVNGVTTEAEVNGVAMEAVEAGVDVVATEAVVNGVTTEAEVNGVTTEAEVNGVTMEAETNSVAMEAVEAEVDVVATEAVVNGVATEAVVDGVAAEVEVNSVATESVVDVAEGPAAMEAVVDVAEEPAAMEASVIITERVDETVVEKTTERVDETVVEKTTELKDGKTTGKGKAKKKKKKQIGQS